MSQSKLRALAIFHDYLDLPDDQQSRMRESLSEHDPELLDALLSLVAASRSPSPLDVPAPEIASRWPVRSAREPASPDSRIGSVLGAWRIDRVVAEGGMGTVYEAHRADGQYEQRVALKCVRARSVSPSLLEAILVERRHLAALNHPGIAVLLDGGVDADAMPWFAMRFVEGVPIDTWCDARKSTVAERIRLVLQACSAIGYAHANGVVHRDIKPSNLLVTEAGQVQLVDFGISSLFSESGQADSPQVAFSRDYTAPEVVSGGAHGVASDMYGVGALLYQLLCASTPTSKSKLWPIMPGPASSEVKPLALMAAEATDEQARDRGERNSAALARRLSGDLSAIAAKAVAARPGDRYSSMHELAEELERYLTHRPVKARRRGFFYRAGKFVGRNPAAVLVSGALILALAGVTCVSVLHRLSAAREAEAAATVSVLFSSTLGNATLAGLGSTPFSSERLLEKTESELRRLPLSQHPVLKARSLASLARSYAVIGNYGRAERIAFEAQRILGDNRDDSGFVAATRLSLLNTKARYPQAAQLAKQWIEDLDGRNDRASRLTRATYMGQLAIAQWGLAEPYVSLRTLGDALREIRSLGPGNDELIAELLIQRSNSNRQLLRYQEAIADTQQAISLALHVNPVLADDAREQLINIQARKGGHIDVNAAEQLYASRRRTLGDRHAKTGMAWIYLGYSQARAGKPVTAQAQSQTGMALIESAYGKEHPVYADALTLSSFVITRHSRNNLQSLREALGIFERTLGPRHESTLSAKHRVAARLADLPSLQPSDFDEIRRLYEDNLRIKLSAKLPTAWEHLYLGRAWLRYGKREDLTKAEALLAESRKDAGLYFSAGDNYPLLSQMSWAELRYLQGHKAWADREFDRIAADNQRKTEFLNAMAFHIAMTFKAAFALENCRQADAEHFIRQAYDRDLQIAGADNFLTKDAKDYQDSLREQGVLRSREESSPLHLTLASTNERARRCPRKQVGK